MKAYPTGSYNKRLNYLNKSNNKNWFIRHKILIFGIVIFSVLGYLYKDLPKISYVNIYDGNNILREESVVDELQGKYWINVSDDYIKKIVEDANSKYEVENLKRDYIKSQLIIYLVKRQPKYYIKSSYGNFLVDENGFVISKSATNPDKLTTVVYDRDDIEVGTYIDSNILKSAIWYAQHELPINIKDDVLTTTVENVLIYLPVVKTLEEANRKVSLLQKVIQQYTIKDKKIENIDLRFSDPLIKYKI